MIDKQRGDAGKRSLRGFRERGQFRVQTLGVHLDEQAVATEVETSWAKGFLDPFA